MLHSPVQRDCPGQLSCSGTRVVSIGQTDAIFHAAGSLKSQSSGLQPCISKQTTASASSVSLDANELDDDTLGEILSKLPLQHLVQLSSCSRRLYRLVQQSDKVIKSLDLQQVGVKDFEFF